MPQNSNSRAEGLIRPNRNPLHVAVWLLIICVMIYVIIAIGGYTRLTNSGLSIVTWQPVSGIIPPLTEDQWQAEFDIYKQFPEFQIVNPDLTLVGFKQIFWIEYVHRLAGRLVALVFLLPFLYFLFRGYLTRRIIVRLAAVFVLGGVQGLLGWYMVKSGLINNPSVSQYRLTAHLSLAVILYSYVLWLSVSLFGFHALEKHPSLPSIRRLAVVCIGLVALMQLSGGFMAGTHAGFVINTYPDMNGKWVPDLLFSLSPLWRNLFENVITIQFFHRWMAVATVLAIAVLWLQRFRIKSKSVRLGIDIAFLAALMQFSLGVSTLLSQVEISIAIAHQSGFVLLLSVLIILIRATLPTNLHSSNSVI